jgi:hypothetical protein
VTSGRLAAEPVREASAPGLSFGARRLPLVSDVSTFFSDEVQHLPALAPSNRRESELTDSEPSEAREERLAKNEVIFRTVNESIEQKALQMGGLDEYEFICECSTAECFERISLTLRQYEHIRREGVRFVVTPGHEDVEVELVVGKSGAYWIVEKDGTAGIVAEFADPRDGDPGHG